MTENIFTVCKTYLWLHVFFYKCHIFSVKDLYQRTNWYFKSTQKCCACNFYYKSTNVCSQMQNFLLLFTLQGEKNLKTQWIHLIWSKIGHFFHLWITESKSLLSVYPLKRFTFLIWMIMLENVHESITGAQRSHRRFEPAKFDGFLLKRCERLKQLCMNVCHGTRMANMSFNKVCDEFERVIEGMEWEEIVCTLLEIIEAELVAVPPAELPISAFALHYVVLFPGSWKHTDTVTGKSRGQGPKLSSI